MSDEPKKRRIRYTLERNGGERADTRQDMDNPFSPNFMTLDARNEGDKARWWALYGKRRARPGTAAMERDK